MSVPSQPKQKVVALLLAIFLGGFGAHYFYLDRSSFGVMRLGASILCAIPVIGQVWLLLVVLPWHLIDIIRVGTGSLRGADGMPLV